MSFPDYDTWKTTEPGYDGPEDGGCVHICYCAGCPGHTGACLEQIEHDEYQLDEEHSTARRSFYTRISCDDRPYCDECQIEADKRKLVARQIRKSIRRHERKVRRRFNRNFGRML